MLHLNINLSFKLEKSRRKGPEFPILLRVRLGRSGELKINTGQVATEAAFVGGRIKGKTAAALNANNELDRQRVFVQGIFDTMLRENNNFPVSFEDFKKRLQRETQPAAANPANAVIQFDHLIQQHLEAHTQDYTRLTAGKYETLIKALHEFIALPPYKKKFSLALADISFDFYTAFRKFLAEEHTLKTKDGTIKQVGVANNTANNYLKNIIAVLRYYYNHGTPVIRNQINLDFMRFKKYREVKNNRQALNRSEAEAIYRYDLSGNPRLERVRDIYIFCCWTGLRFSDAMRMTQANLTLVNGEVEVQWIMGKTLKKNRVPLLGDALDVVRKYQDCYGTLLPPISNQKANEYLDEVWEVLRETMPDLALPVETVTQKGKVQTYQSQPRYKLLTFHTSRHSYARILMRSGASTEHVRELLGHGDIKTTQIYAKTDIDHAISSTRKLLGDK